MTSVRMAIRAGFGVALSVALRWSCGHVVHSGPLKRMIGIDAGLVHQRHESCGARYFARTEIRMRSMAATDTEDLD